MIGPRDDTAGSDTGFALVAVLAFLLVTAAFTTPFLASAKIQALVTRNTGQLTREKILLRGLIEVAGVRFFELYQNRGIATASAVRCPAGNSSGPDIIFHFQDHSGLIDLNAASADLLTLGFESLAIGRDEAAAVGSEAVRFRSVDGGQRFASDRTPPRGGHKHALFERTGELQDLLVEMNIAQNDIERVFTVHSGAGTVDESASQGALLAKLQALKAGERYFVVNNVRRGAALTVEAELAVASGRRVSGSAVLAPAEISGQVRFLEPLSLGRAPKKTTPGMAGAVEECTEFFDPVLLETIAKVTS